MRVTRYPQSCLLIEDGPVRIVIDPGTDYVEGGYDRTTLGKLDAVLYTHQHTDHYDKNLCEVFLADGVPVYANASTAKLIGAEKCTIVTDHQEFEIGGVKLKALELPHSLLPDGSEGPQNTGYLIDGVLFHPGDGKELDGLKVNNLALPITGPDISMMDAFNFAKQVEAKTVIPIHYDKLGAKPEAYEMFFGFFNPPFKTVILGNGESVDLG